MIISIDKKEYEVPNKLTLRKWAELMSWGFVEENYEIIISIGIGIPIEDCVHIPPKIRDVIIFVLQTLMNPPIVSNRKLAINLNEITFGDFIDMDIYINNGIHKYLDKVVPLLFDMEYREDLYINDVWDGLIHFFNFRKNIFNRYKNLFNAEDAPEDEEEKDKTPIEYVWWEILMILADGKFLNIKQATKEPLIQALNFISWNKDKNTREINRQKKLRNEL